MDSVDQLSDEAMAATKAADATHSDEAHKEAKAKHEHAYAAAKMANRPSLAQHHLQMAASHDRASDPTTPEGKSLVAKRASTKAQQSGKAEDHDVAAQAHKDAADASLSRTGARPFAHHNAAAEHEMQARQIRNPPQRPMGL